MSRNNDYTTENLLDYLYHQKYYKLIGIDLSRQKNASIPQQINFVGKLKQCFYRWKAARTISLDSLIIAEYSNINNGTSKKY